MPTSDNDILLQVNHLSTGYDKRQVLFDVSLEVKRGEIVLLIGGNGSGKSTLLKSIYGLVTTGLNTHFSLKGCINFDNEDITCIKPYELIKKGLVYVPQKNNTFEHLTVIENLEVVGTYLNSKAEIKKRINVVVELLPQLTKLTHMTPFHLSGGEKQQLALGMALMQQPKMILLDEPGAGLSPNAWKRNLETIKVLNESGITFLIVEHRLKESLEIASRIIALKLGKVFSQFTMNAPFNISELNSVFI